METTVAISLTVNGVAGDLTVNARNSRLDVRGVTGAADLTTSFDEVVVTETTIGPDDAVD